MNSIISELTNLENGAVAAGDLLAATICRDAINEIKRLRRLAIAFLTNLPGGEIELCNESLAEEVPAEIHREPLWGGMSLFSVKHTATEGKEG